MYNTRLICYLIVVSDSKIYIVLSLLTNMVIQRRLGGKTPEEQVQEVVRIMSQDGLNPNCLLYRVFNSGKTNTVLLNGTDRSGVQEKRQEEPVYSTGKRTKAQKFYEEMGASSWDEMLGYDTKLREMGLSRQDGLWCCRLDSLRKNLDQNHDVVVPGNVAIAVYDPSKLTEVGVEFYAFKTPERKLDALVSVISDTI